MRLSRRWIRHLPAAALLCLPACRPHEDAALELVVPVRTATAETRDIEAVVTGPATVFPLAEAKVAARLTAPIEKLAAAKGDAVRRGQVLARLVAGDLQAQRAEAAAQVESAEAELEKLSAGTLPADIERARGQVESTAAALAEAEKIYRRRKALFEEGAIPERELLLAETRYEQARTAHRVAKRSLELLLEHSREQDIRMARSRLEQARARLQYIEEQLSYAEIRSPFDGVVTEQFLYPGDMAGPGMPIFTVMDLSVAVARAQVPLEEAGAVRRGQPCRFSSVDGAGRVFRGKVTVVNQAADPQRRTVEIWCAIPNRDGRLKAGAFGEAGVITAVHRAATVVPLPAVQFEEGRPRGVVWVAGADGAAHERKVATGLVDGERVEILSGVEAGEEVIVEGAYGLVEGVRLRVLPADGGEAGR